MKKDLCFFDKSNIALEILAYLSEHPRAQDTIDGIVQWWLLEREIRYKQNKVKEALAELILNGFILEKKRLGSGNYFCLNQDKSEEINVLLEQRKQDIDGN